MAKQFHRTTITVLVLHDEPWPDEWSLEDVAYWTNEGHMVWTPPLTATTETLTGKEMADALYAAGSQPDFFNLDDDGNETED